MLLFSRKNLSVLTDLILVYSMKLKIKDEFQNQASDMKFLLSRIFFLDLSRYMNTVTYRNNSYILNLQLLRNKHMLDTGTKFYIKSL